METVRKIADTFGGPTTSAASPKNNSPSPTRDSLVQNKNNTNMKNNNNDNSKSDNLNGGIPSSALGATKSPSPQPTPFPLSAPTNVASNSSNKSNMVIESSPSSSFLTQPKQNKNKQASSPLTAQAQQQQQQQQSFQLTASNSTSLIGANLRLLQELQLVDQYALFHELYHYMGSLYQVMKTTVGSSANVVGVSSSQSASNRKRQEERRESKIKIRQSVRGLSKKNIYEHEKQLQQQLNDEMMTGNGSGSTHPTAPNPNHTTATRTSIISAVRQSLSNLKNNVNNNSNETLKPSLPPSAATSPNRTNRKLPPTTNNNSNKPFTSAATTSSVGGGDIKSVTTTATAAALSHQGTAPFTAASPSSMRAERGSSAACVAGDKEGKTAEGTNKSLNVKESRWSKDNFAEGTLLHSQMGKRNSVSSNKDSRKPTGNDSVVEGEDAANSNDDLASGANSTATDRGGGGGGESDEEDESSDDDDDDEPQYNVGKHYYLVLPRDEALQTLLLMKTSDNGCGAGGHGFGGGGVGTVSQSLSTIPTFAASPEQKRTRDERSKRSQNNSMRISSAHAENPLAQSSDTTSELQHGNATKLAEENKSTSAAATVSLFGGGDGHHHANDDEGGHLSAGSFKPLLRIRHNVVRCHLFQGEQHLIVRRRNNNNNNGTRSLSRRNKANNFASPDPAHQHEQQTSISLTGLSGLNGTLTFHLDDNENGNRSGNNNKQHADGNSNDSENPPPPVALVTITPVAMPLSSASAAINTNINITGFNTIGNITILYADKAVVEQQAPSSNTNGFISNNSLSQSPAGGGGGMMMNTASPSNNNHNTSSPSSVSSSQMWWQRVPMSVLTQMPSEMDPPPQECPVAAAHAQAEDDELMETMRVEHNKRKAEEKRRQRKLSLKSEKSTSRHSNSMATTPVSASPSSVGSPTTAAAIPEIDVNSSDAFDLPQRVKIYNYFPEPKIISLFKQDEQRLIAVLQHELDSKGFPADEILTNLDTEIGMFNSAYVCMKGFEGFIVSKVQSIVESAQESLFTTYQEREEKEQQQREEERERRREDYEKQQQRQQQHTQQQQSNNNNQSSTTTTAILERHGINEANFYDRSVATTSVITNAGEASSGGVRSEANGDNIEECGGDGRGVVVGSMVDGLLLEDPIGSMAPTVATADGTPTHHQDRHNDNVDENQARHSAGGGGALSDDAMTMSNRTSNPTARTSNMVIGSSPPNMNHNTSAATQHLISALGNINNNRTSDLSSKQTAAVPHHSQAAVAAVVANNSSLTSPLLRHASSAGMGTSGGSVGMGAATSCSSARSCTVDYESNYRCIVSEDEEEQIGAVLHIIVTSGIASKLNSHWSSVNSVDDYAFYHACVSLRKSIEKRLPEFLPDICIGKLNVASFADVIRICRYIDAPDASLFSIMRAMEASISSIVTLVTSCCAPGKTHEVTADVCIPMIVLVLILAALQSLPSKIRLILELIVPVLELSSLGYALTTFEASAEQIHHEYAHMVANRGS